MSSNSYLQSSYLDVRDSTRDLIRSVIALSRRLPTSKPPSKSLSIDDFDDILEALDSCETVLTSIREKISRLEGYSHALVVSPAFTGDYPT